MNCCRIGILGDDVAQSSWPYGGKLGKRHGLDPRVVDGVAPLVVRCIGGHRELADGAGGGRRGRRGGHRDVAGQPVLHHEGGGRSDGDSPPTSRGQRRRCDGRGDLAGTASRGSHCDGDPRCRRCRGPGIAGRSCHPDADGSAGRRDLRNRRCERTRIGGRGRDVQQSYIEIVGLHAFASAVRLIGNHNTVDSLSVEYSSHLRSFNAYATQGAVNQIVGDDNTWKNSIIEKSGSAGLIVAGNRNLIENNIVTDVGYQATNNAGLDMDNWTVTIRATNWSTTPSHAVGGLGFFS